VCRAEREREMKKIGVKNSGELVPDDHQKDGEGEGKTKQKSVECGSEPEALQF